MQRLIKGIIDFREKSLTEYREKFSRLARGQMPDALFIACCDSRVVPNVFASSDPGELFVLRNIGNLVPPFHDKPSEHPTDTSVASTIEFAVKKLNVSDIIVCGHSECAAMQYFVTPHAQDNLVAVDNWLNLASPSYERFQQCRPHGTMAHVSPHNQLSLINVLQQLDHIKTYPWVKERLENNTIKLHGWWFDLATADVYEYSQNKDDFIVIDHTYDETHHHN